MKRCAIIPLKHGSELGSSGRAGVVEASGRADSGVSVVE